MAMTSLGMMAILMAGIMGSGANFMGMPPGERDAAYLQAAPADSLLYVEWASRGKGKAGGKGIDGLAADPEVQQFFSQLKTAILEMIEKETERGGREEKLMAQHVPPLIESLINQSGCLYFQYEPPKKLEGEDQNLGPNEALGMIAQINLTLIVNAGEDAGKVEQHLIKLLEYMAEDFGIDPPGNKLDQYILPIPVPILSAKLHREGNYIILGIGEKSLPRAISGLKGEVEGLGKSETFNRYFDKVKMDRVGGIGWLDIKQLKDKAKSMAPAEYVAIAESMLDSLGIQAVDGAIGVTGVIDGQVVSRSYVQTGPGNKGLLALVSGRSLSASDYSHVPADSDFVTSFSLPLGNVLSAAQETVNGVDPVLGGNAEEMKQGFEQQFGFSLDEDLPAAFGDHWTMFDSKSAGGVFVSSVVMSLEVKDADKAQMIYDKLMTLLEDALPGIRKGEYSTRGVELKTGTFLDQTIHYINTVGDDVPIAPAFCLTDKYLWVGLHPQSLKSQLRFLKDGGDSLAGSLKGVLPAKGNVICYSEFDLPQLMRYAYAITPWMAQIGFSEAQRDGFKMDIFSVPSARAILPYIQKSQSWIVRTADGVLFESRGSIPLPPVLGILPSFLGLASPMRFDEVRPAIEAPEIDSEDVREEFGFVVPKVLAP